MQLELAPVGAEFAPHPARAAAANLCEAYNGADRIYNSTELEPHLPTNWIAWVDRPALARP